MISYSEVWYAVNPFSHIRHERGPGNSGLIQLWPPAGLPPYVSSLTTDTVTLRVLPDEQEFSVAGYPPMDCGFAFWIITGVIGSESIPLFITDNTGVSISLINTSNVSATAYFGAYRAGDGGPNGIFLDAFDADLGVDKFVNDNFVSVTPESVDPLDSGGVYDLANDGFLPTDWQEYAPGVSSCKIKAYASIPEGAKFLQWLVPAALNGPVENTPKVAVDATSPDTLDVPSDSEAWAFAVYQTPTPIPPPPLPCGKLLQQIRGLAAQVDSMSQVQPGGWNYPSATLTSLRQELARLVEYYVAHCGPIPPLSGTGIHVGVPKP